MATHYMSINRRNKKSVEASIGGWCCGAEILSILLISLFDESTDVKTIINALRRDYETSQQLYITRVNPYVKLTRVLTQSKFTDFGK